MARVSKDPSSLQHKTEKGAPKKDGGNENEADEPRVVVAFVRGRPVDGTCVSLAGADELLLGRASHQESFEQEGRTIKLRLVDSEISRWHAAVRRVPGGWQLTDLGSTNRTYKNGELVRESTFLLDGSLIEIGRTVVVFRAVGPGPAATLGRTFGGGDVTTTSTPIFPTWCGKLEHSLVNLASVALLKIPVLVRGETGTGKELVAQAVHRLSERRGNLISIDCGALAETLVESQLFGAVKGAFSGADRDKVGLIRAADGGTLFLDEIANLSLDKQAVFLRVLQDHKVLPLGGVKPIPVDIRSVAATNLDLRAMVQQGKFRQDLYARLVGFDLELPPLRERREDIGLLAATILRELGEKPRSVTLDSEATRALLVYPYPQNVRELKSALEVALSTRQGEKIEIKNLPMVIQSYRPPKPGPAEEKQRRELEKHISAKNGNLSAVGREMGTSHQQVRRWARKFKIDVEKYRKPKA